MNKVLCFDFGNTNGKMACYNELNNEVTIEKMAEISFLEVQRLLNKYNPKSAILSSVINHDPKIEELLHQQLRLHVLSNKSKLNFTTPVGKPQEIGADRIAICQYAVANFPNLHNLVICLGTCITYNFIDIHHQFLGGGISPGLELRFKSLNKYTAFLPLVDYHEDFPLIGYDTETNILTAVIKGIQYEIDGIINEYSIKYNKLNVILTGGNLKHFENRLKNKIFAEKNVIFEGLKNIHDQNLL